MEAPWRSLEARSWVHLASWLARPVSSSLLFVFPLDLREKASIPGQSDRGEPLGHKFPMWLFSFCPRTPQLTCEVPVVSLYMCAKRHLLQTKTKALWTTFPSFILLLLFLPIQQCSVNTLGYELMQACGLLLGQKGRLCCGNDICFPAFSLKLKSLSLLSRFFSPRWNHGKDFQFIQ